MSGELVDISEPSLVEIQIRWDGKVIWVNVDQVCRLRINNIEQIRLIDQRPRPTSEPSPDDREDG